jgi:hypothetical protein
MKVLEIYPKDIHVVFEISLVDLELLHKAIAMAKIDYDSKNDGESRAVNYLTKSFYPVIDEIMRKKGNES